ncbi:hypothetical protein FNV43_RR07957 [Rhamnella rubrinervis]|uniref:Retrotransposon gag domain-containing protein n=1 Tax=Rhamnella rubrinervis TaxID=2594499 RepID=A0A8K0HFN2_9ROSA|nr:hypothetical protein FNV43_RR07957 [Rhamnella rubrinervis]
METILGGQQRTGGRNGEDLDSTDEYIPERRTAKPYHSGKRSITTPTGRSLVERIWQRREGEQEIGWAMGETPFVGEIHEAMIPTCIPQPKRDAVMCKVFASSLKGPALLWFSRLPSYAWILFILLAALRPNSHPVGSREGPDDLLRFTAKRRVFEDYINDLRHEGGNYGLSGCGGMQRLQTRVLRYQNFTTTWWKKPEELIADFTKARTFVVLEERRGRLAVKEGADCVSGGRRVGKGLTKTTPEWETSEPRGETAGWWMGPFRKLDCRIKPVSRPWTIHEVRWRDLNLDRRRRIMKWCVFHRWRASGGIWGIQTKLKNFKAWLFERVRFENQEKWAAKSRRNPPKTSPLEVEESFTRLAGTACGGERREDRRAYTLILLPNIGMRRRSRYRVPREDPVYDISRAHW